MTPTPQQIRAARAGLDWTQRQLAKAAGIHARTIKMIERGKVAPQAATWRGIAKAFATHGVLFGEDRRTVILPDPAAAPPRPSIAAAAPGVLPQSASTIAPWGKGLSPG